ncbi:TniB family NTP-binding protein [Streptomyces sp. ISL-43]|uniref:AAA family ATPase n=1 Tax=Streptomyces sp. ISL-43 TaxID=2819183 RepID=UPI001BE7FE4B|nr:AAA family ATPase [Streptomyces sp. ISL-43]MBT2446353.1 TniB family NTP-binding protein [Streptomyces sp. ISL-43]
MNAYGGPVPAQSTPVAVIEGSMDMLWPDRLGVGDRVRFGGRACTVTELYGRRLTLADAFGGVQQVDVVALLQSDGFEVLDHEPRPTQDRAQLLGEDAAQRARWWRSHVVEVMTGLPWDAPPGSQPRDAYDPARHTLGEREEAKAEELAWAGVHGASVRTVRRKRQRYAVEGLAGLADGRAVRREDARARWDPRVMDAMREAGFDSAHGERNVETVRRLVAQRLQSAVEAGELTLPSRSAFHRLYAEMVATDSLRGPQRWPGRLVVLDTVWLPSFAEVYAVRGGLRLVLAIDVDTSVLLTAVVHEGLHPLDPAALLARMCVPADQRASWGVWPPVVLEAAAGERPAAPVIRPEVLVVDRSPVLRARRLTEACRRLGIRVQYGTGTIPTGKVSVETLAAHVAARFSDYLHSPAGTSARAAGWPVEQVQGLLDDWVQVDWSRRELPTYDGALTTPDTSGSPASRYAMLVARSGWITPPLEPVKFLDLLPSARRVVSPSGVHLRGRRYDGRVLDRFLRRVPPSGRSASWSVRWDPYDTRQIWICTPQAEWVTVPSASTSSLRHETPAEPSHHERPSLVHTRVTQGITPGTALTPRTFDDTGRKPLHPPPPVTAPAQIRVAYHAQLPLYTPDVLAAVARAEDLIVLNEHGGGARRSILLNGAAGTGKTTVLQELARRCTEWFPTVSDDGAMPVVQVRLPPAPTARVLLRELARAAGSPAPARGTITDLIRHVRDSLAAKHTRLVLVDEFHQFHTRAEQPSPVTEVVAYLCDSVQATFVFAGFPPRTGEWGAHRRLLSVSLGPMTLGEAWLDMIARAEAALRLRAHVPGTLPELAGHLHELTGGSAQHLAYLLRSGSIRAIREGVEELNRPLLDDLASPWRATTQ